MSIDTTAGGESLSTSQKPAKTAKPARIPVARPATLVPKIQGGPEPEKADLVEDLLSPPSIKGFAWSIGAHVILLLILAFWFFSPPTKAPQVIDTRLAGSEFGDPNGDQLKGGLGMDEPATLPETANAPSAPEPDRTITAMPVSEIAPSLTAKPRDEGKASAGGGIGLSGPRQAGNGDGFGVAKFGSGGEKINGVDVKVGDPQFTLIWDSVADIDLHVFEPGGSEIWWSNRLGHQGGELDVDDVDGYGPENVNFPQNVGPRGTYRWLVHYYGGDFGRFHPTRWKVRVKHGGKVELFQGKFKSIGDKSVAFEFKLAEPGGPVDPKETPGGAKVVAEGPAETPRPAAATGSAPTPVPSRSGPFTFAPPGSAFSLTLPSEPRAGRKDWETSIGVVVAQSYSVEGTDGAIAVFAADFPASAVARADSSRLLDELADKAVAEAKGTGAKKSKIALGGSAGREVEFALPETIVAGGGSGRVRAFLVGPRAVVVSVHGLKSYVEGPEVSSLFSSLKLVETK